MIIWVGARFKPLLARRAIVLENEMITWVGNSHLRWRVRLVSRKNEMIIWGTHDHLGLGDADPKKTR